MTVTHDQEEALALSDRMAVMNRAEVLQVGSLTQVYARTRTRFVADFIGEANLVSGLLAGLAPGMTIAIRPEDIAVNVPTPGRRTMAATVGMMTFLGADRLVEAHLADGTPIRARVRGASAGIAPGDSATLSWDQAREWVLTE